MNFQIRPCNSTLADYKSIASIHNATWQTDGLTAENRQLHDSKRAPGFLFQRLLVESEEQIIAHAAYGEDAWNHTPAWLSFEKRLDDHKFAIKEAVAQTG